MDQLWLTHATVAAAAAAGRTSAVAGEGQRDLQRCAAQAPELFPARPFDATLFGTLSMANAFSGGDLPATALTMANRASLWGFAVDWQIDFLATGVDQVDAVVARCLAVASGGAAEDPLTEFLASLRHQVAAAPALQGAGGADLLAAWAAELGRMLAGMRREWEWRSTKVLPTVDEYVENADNLGSSFVNVSHWMFTTADADPTDLPLVTEATRAEQKVIRLLNDLGTYQRDLAWGDINALMLGVDAKGIALLIEDMVIASERTFASLQGRAPRLVDFLRRQIGFCTGFYGVTDYWGEL